MRREADAQASGTTAELLVAVGRAREEREARGCGALAFYHTAPSHGLGGPFFLQFRAS